MNDRQNILVTGSNGQLGNEMRRLAVGINSGRYLFTDVEELDITNLEAIRETLIREKIGVVVNCAAYTNVDKAEDDFQTADLINNKAVEHLAVACKEQLFETHQGIYHFSNEGTSSHTQEIWPTSKT